MGVVGDPVREARFSRRASLLTLDKEQLVQRLINAQDRLAELEKRESDRGWKENPPQGSL